MSNYKPANFSLMFRLNRKRIKNGNFAIYLRITIDKKRIELATKHFSPHKKWNQKQQFVTGASDEAKEVNKHLAIIKADILKHYIRLTALEQP